MFHDPLQGLNDAGQLGDGTTSQRLVPTLVVGAANWTLVAVGQAHTCALRSDRRLLCWVRLSGVLCGLRSAHPCEVCGCPGGGPVCLGVAS